MAISDSDYKILWGRAAGICSNPTCRSDLTILLASSSYNVGEMAHIIARKPRGPRGQKEGGEDTYANLILLCPTCHRKIDKAPEGEYPEEMLHSWKSNHEDEIRKVGSKQKFQEYQELKTAVSRRLLENKKIFEEFGPHSAVAKANPLSNLSEAWALRKLSTIVPNNSAIINIVESNIDLLSKSAYDAFLKFKNHATAFEKNQYHRLDSYPLFPVEFEEEFLA